LLLLLHHFLLAVPEAQVSLVERGRLCSEPLLYQQQVLVQLVLVLEAEVLLLDKVCRGLSSEVLVLPVFALFMNTVKE
jgi:hypothetical protein